MGEFWIKRGSDKWRSATKAEYVAAERSAGFRNTLGQPDEPATSAFAGTVAGVPTRGEQGFLHAEEGWEMDDTPCCSEHQGGCYAPSYPCCDECPEAEG